MNVYDFDKTIFPKDSTACFWKHCMKRYPACRRAIPVTLLYGLLYATRICKRDTFKEKMYSFLCYLPDTASEASSFWDGNETKIFTWYLSQKKSDDLIISASPEFLILEIARRLGVTAMASPVDPTTGKLLGPNCRDSEKVRRFKEVYGEAEVDEFYSDSLADTPMAEYSRKAFQIVKGKICPWPEK